MNLFRIIFPGYSCLLWAPSADKAEHETILRFGSAASGVRARQLVATA